MQIEELKGTSNTEEEEAQQRTSRKYRTKTIAESLKATLGSQAKGPCILRVKRKREEDALDQICKLLSVLMMNA